MTCASLKTKLAQTGATGAKLDAASCAAPLPYRGADNWRTGADTTTIELAQF